MSLFLCISCLVYRLLERKVNMLMGTRGDYKGWYYVPTGERRAYIQRGIVEDRKELPARGSLG